MRKNYIAAYTTNMVKGNLGVYDADYGTYPVSIDGLGRIYAKVPAEEAELFKGYWNQIQLEPQYGVIDDQLAILPASLSWAIRFISRLPAIRTMVPASSLPIFLHWR